ncbi:MAG: PIN domain-containing protein [Acidobacteriota bacterium]|nr:PIN domain-containing protein [Acidobacteriota bacterium]MDH3524742.1 PIN domain-containing protein [Acidobacteriota bacterium]
MVALLDVNVLVALFDGAHIHHESAHYWFGRRRDAGWATCPLTENGFVRVISSAAYPGRRTTVSDAIDRLRAFSQSGGHVFWEDSVSLRDAALVDPGRIGGAPRVTNVYLLALALRRGGRLATFDRKISRSAVAGAEARHLALIEP